MIGEIHVPILGPCAWHRADKYSPVGRRSCYGWLRKTSVYKIRRRPDMPFLTPDDHTLPYFTERRYIVDLLAENQGDADACVE